MTATGRTEGDVRIRGGVIAEIGINLPDASGARVIDAKGMLVLPGGVDPHVHLGMRPGMQGSDDYTTGSRAALAGGVTTIANFINQVPNEATGRDDEQGRRGGEDAGDRRRAAARDGQRSERRSRRRTSRCWRRATP